MRGLLIAMRSAVLALMITVALLVVPLPAQAAPQQLTATENLNVRAKPSTSSKIIGGLSRGQAVTGISTSKGWTKIKFGTGPAYVSSQYLSKSATLAPSSASAVGAGLVKITTANLNLRKGPGLSYDVIRVLREGTRVTTTGKASRGFAELVNGSSTGWASMQYLVSATSGLPAIVGTRKATADLDIRTSSGSDAKTVAEVKKGTKLSVTGVVQNGRAQIIYQNKVRWVTAKYLSNPEVNLPAPPGLPKITGVRYATATLNIRSTYKDSYTLITEVPRGTELDITGVVKQGRMQIVYQNAVRWVTNKYLSKTKPSAGSPDPSWAKVEKNLQPNAIQVHRAVRAKFPQITTIYGWRRDVTPDHPAGRALDLMIPNYKSSSGKKLGGEVALWLKANARSLDINYVIWNQRIWNIERNSEGWRYMADRGGDSANHKNHVHVTVYDG